MGGLKLRVLRCWPQHFWLARFHVPHKVTKREATAGRIGFAHSLLQSSALVKVLGLRMRELLMVYLLGVILLLAVSTTIDGEDGVGLDHILIAGFGWPILTPIMALRAFTGR